MGLGGVQTLTSNITAANDTYTFMGAKPSEIATLSGIGSTSISTQLTNKLDATGGTISNHNTTPQILQ
jgi:hypothetical protein